MTVYELDATDGVFHESWANRMRLENADEIRITADVLEQPDRYLPGAARMAINTCRQVTVKGISGDEQYVIHGDQLAHMPGDEYSVNTRIESIVDALHSLKTLNRCLAILHHDTGVAEDPRSLRSDYVEEFHWPPQAE